jgi:hypothetical protein
MAQPGVSRRGSSASGTTLTSGSLSETSGSLAATAEWAGRVNAAALVYTWDGSSSSDWGTAANWDLNTVPSLATDQIVIPTAASYTNALVITGTRSCDILRVDGTGTFSMGASSTLTVNGNFDVKGSGTPTFDCTSTLNMANAGADTIYAFNYGNLNATGGNRTLASSGTIGICGTFTRGAGTYTVTGSTVNFNGTGAQSITIGTYNNLSISGARGAAAITLPAGTISVGGAFDVSTLSAFTASVNAASIFDFTSAGVQSIPAFFYGQLNSTGNGNRTWASSGIIDINQGFSPGTGIQTITGSTVQYSNTAATTWTLTTFTTNFTAPARQYNNLIFNGGSTTNWSLNGLTVGVAANLTITSGTVIMGSAAGVAVLNVDGILALNGANGTLNISNSNTNGGTLNLLGNFVQSNGTFTKTGTSACAFNFSKASGTQTINKTGGTFSAGTITTSINIGTGATTNTVQLLTDFAVTSGTFSPKNLATFDFQTFLLTGTSTFTTVAGTTLKSANTNTTGAFTTSGANGSIQSSGVRTYNAGTNFFFSSSTSDQYTGNGVGQFSVASLTINTAGTTKVNLTTSVVVTGTVLLASGILVLNTADIQLNSAATFTGSPWTTTNMVVTVGNASRYSGRIIKVFPNGPQTNLTFTYPLGDTTGTKDYSPVNITDLDYTAASSPYIDFKVKDAKHPNDPSLTDYLTRYWETVSSFPSGAGITMTATFGYVAADVVGSETSIKMNRFDQSGPNAGTLTEDAGSSAGSNLLTSITLNGAGSPADFDFDDEDIIGRLTAPLYYLSNNATGTFEVASDWLVFSDPGFTTPPGGAVPTTYPTFSNSDSIRIQSGHNMTVSTLAGVDNMRIESGGTLTLGSGMVLPFTVNNGTGVDLRVEGSVVNQSAFAWSIGGPAGSVQFSNGALYNHNVAAGTIPASNWVTGSECRVTGTLGVAPAGLGQAFSDFTWACPSMSSLSLAGALTNVGRDFTVSNTNSLNLSLVASTGSLALTVGRHFNITGGNVIMTTGTVTPTATVGGNLTISGNGSLVMVNSASNGTGTATLAVTGTTSVTSSVGTALILTSSIGGTPKAATLTSTGAFTLNGTGTISLSQATNGAVGTLTANGLVSITSGTLNVSNTSASAVGILNANAGITVNGGTLNGSTLGTATINVADNQTATFSSGSVNIAPAGTGTLNVGTITTSITSTSLVLSGATLNVSSGGTGVVNLYNDLTLSSGSLTKTGAGTGTVNFVARGAAFPSAPHSQIVTQSSATVSGTIAFNVGATGSNSLLSLGSNVDFGSGSTTTVTGFGATNFSYLDFGTHTLAGLNFTQSNFGVMTTAHPDGFWTIATGPSTGSLLTTGSRNLNANGNFSFNGTGTQVTGDAVTSAFNFSSFNSLGTLTLSNNLTISTSGILFLNYFGLHGKLYLSTFNLTISSGASISGASSTDYIVTNSTGQLRQTVGASTSIYPVGNSAYNPMTLNNTGGTSDVYGVNVVDAVTSPAPFDGTKLINRYWVVTEAVGGGSSLAVSGQYNGGEENANFAAGTTLRMGLYTTLWSQNGATSSGSGPFIVSSSTDFTSIGTFGIGKDDGFLTAVTTYTWNGSASSSWATPANWTPATSVAGPTSTDNIVINVPGSNVLDINSSRSVTDFSLSGTGTFIMSGSSDFTINGNLTYSSSATPTFSCASTFNIFSTGSQTIPAFNYGNLNSTGGDRVLASSGTIGICGTFTRGAGTYTLTGSTINYNGSGVQTISAGTYNNLTISNARGGSALTLGAGTIDVAGTFDPSPASAYTVTVGTNVFNFSSAGAQPIPAFFYYSITNSGNGNRTWASSGVIDINFTFSPGTGTHTITGSSVRYSDLSAGTATLTSFTTNVASRHYNNLEIVGGASSAWVLGSGFNLGVDGDFVLSGAGTFTVATNATANTMVVDGNLTINGTGNLIVANTATATLVNSLTVAGNTTISSGSLIGVGSSSGTTVQGNFTTNDLTISGTGIMNLDAASNTANSAVTVNGNMSVTSSTANAVNFGSGTNTAANVINLKNNLTKSGSGTFGCSGTFNATSGFVFNKGSGTQTLDYSGAAMTSSNFTVASGSTLQLLSNLTLGSNATASSVTVAGILDCQGFVISIGNAANAFALQATGSLQTSHTSGVSSAISGFTNANTSWAAGATFVFTGTAQSAGMSGYANISSASLYTVTWLGNTSLTLDKSLSLNVFNFTNSGLVNMGNFNISLPSSAGALTGSGFGVSKMFVTNGTGILSRAVLVAGTGLPFTWPIGESTGTTEYSPVTIASIASAGINGSIGFRVIDGVQPNMSPATSYISRYWPCTVTGFNATFTLGSSTFTYDAATDVVVGPEASLKGNIYNTATSLWTELATSSSGSNVLTITSGLAGSFMPTTGGPYDITGRIDVPTYYRSVASGNWTTLTTWEISSDINFVSPTGVTPSTVPSNVNNAGIFIRNAHTVTVNTSLSADDVEIQSGGTLQLTGNSFTLANGAAATDLTVLSGGTLLCASATNNALILASGSTLQVNGLFMQAGSASPDITNSGTINIGATGTYEHARNAGIVPTCNWASGSTCLLSGIGNNMPSGLAQSFHHFTVNTTLTASVNCSGNLTTINGNFNLTTNHATNEFRLSTGSTYTLTVGGNFNVTNAFFSPASGGVGPCNVVVNGTTTMTGASSRIDKTGAATVNYTFNGDFTQNAGVFDFNSAGSSNTTVNFRGNVVWNGSILRTNGGTHTINFDKTTGLQTLTVGATFGAGAINWNVSGTSNTLRLLSNLALSNSLQTFTVNTGTTMDFQTFVLSGGNTTFTTGTSPTLMIGSPAGITTAGTAAGNIQTLVRTVNATTTYVYSGSANQNSGTLLPSTLTGAGKLTISNTGAVSDNTVTLTNTLPMTTPQLNLNSGLFAVGTSQTLNIATGGTVNVTSGDFATGSTAGTINFPGTGTWSGISNPFNVSASGGVNFGTGPVTIQSGGVFLINGGGFVNSNAPAYSSGSSLQYNTTGTYGRGLEWSATSGKGYPHHVLISNNTTLNPANTGATNANVPFRCGGNLTISSGSNLYMDFGGNNMIEDLRILGNFNLQGNISLSQTMDSDLFIGGNWTNNGSGANAFMTGVNGRQVEFNGTSSQIIGGSNATVPAFDYVSINNSAADVTTNIPLTINFRLQMNSGKLIIGNNNISIGSSGLIDLGGVTSYIVTNGTGSVSQTVNGGNDWYPVGPSTTAFGPVTLNQSGTGEVIDVRVINVAGLAAPSYQNAVNDTTQMVKLEWVMNESVAGANSIRTTFGWQGAGTSGASNVEGSGFDRTSGVYHGNYNGTKYVVRTSSSTTGSNPYFNICTVAQPFTGTMAAGQRFVLGNINGILPCFQTLLAGDWNTASNWVDLMVPPAGSAVCINHAMTLAATPPNPQFVTVNSPNGNITIAGGVTLILEPGGTFTNNRAGFSMTTGAVAFQGGTSTINGSQVAAFSDLQLGGNTTLTTIPTINNSLEILPGGFILSGTGPNYGSSSTLIYNTGGSYNRSNEWNATSGAGFPASVQVSGGTTLNISNGSNTSRAISGSFTVDNGSSATMSSMTGNLTIPGNFTLNGGFTQSSAFGGDIILGGNWNSGASATFTNNNRDVRFNGTVATQTIANLASGLQFGFLTIDNTGSGVDLLNTITANTFRVNASRTFSLTSDKIIIAAGGDVLINGTFNANSGTVEYTDGGTFTNNGTFNRGTSTIDFLGTSPGSVVGSVQTNFHNIRLAPSSGINFGGGALRGRVSGTFQLRAGSFVTGNAPIYETGSKLMYSGGGTFNRNLEWDPSTVQKVEVTNNTTLKCGTNGTSFTHTMADSLIVQSGSTFDMSSPNMTVPTQVGGNVWLKGTLTLSGSIGGDLELSGDFQNDGGTFNCNSRLTTFNGSLNGSIKGSTNTNFCLLTVNKGIAKSLTATVPFTVSNGGGTIVRVQGGVFDLNGQTMTIGGASPTLRVDAGFANGQTLRTGGTSITSFTNFRSTGANADTLGGKVDYSGSGAETLISPVKGYNLLWITGGATKSITQNTRVNDSLWIAPSTSLDFGAGAHTLESRGHVVNNGTTTGSGTGKIELKGLAAQNMSGSGTYRNLDVNNTNNVNSSGNPTISGKLNVFAGKVFTGSDTIILGSSATITETLGAGEYFVRGNLKTTRTVGTSAESFGGMGVDLTAGSNLGTVVVNRQSGSAITGSAPCCTGFNSIARNWTITPSVQPSVADRALTLSWFSDDDNAMDMTNLQLWKRSTVSDPWLMLDAPQDVSASNPRTASWSSVSSFSQFTGADLNNPLPLSLVKFSGRNLNGTGLLNWTMADQKDLKGFQVEKSIDGKNFSDIGFVAPSIDKAAEPNYSFTDRNLSRDSYYRIRMTHQDGTSTVSHVVIIRIDMLGNADVQLYPNPSTTGAQISIDGNLSGMDVDVRIIGTDGRENGTLSGELETVNAQFSNMVKSLPAGVYQIKVVSEEVTKTLRFIKQ